MFSVHICKKFLSFTDPQQEKEEIAQDISAKLVLENGMVHLPNPQNILDDWIVAPANLPDTTFSAVEEYLMNSDAGKAFRGEKAFFYLDI